MRWAWLWALLACGLVASSAGASGPVKLRATMPVPATEPFMGAPLVAFKGLVEKQTDGSVSVEIFDRGRPYPDETVIEAIRSGLLEMGVIGLNQFARRFTPAALMEQPFLFNFDGLVRAATNPDSEIRQRLDEAILKTMGLRVLWWQTIGTMVVYSKDGDIKDPIRIRGKRLRTFSETFGALCPAVWRHTRIRDRQPGSGVSLGRQAGHGHDDRGRHSVPGALEGDNGDNANGPCRVRVPGCDRRGDLAVAQRQAQEHPRAGRAEG